MDPQPGTAPTPVSLEALDGRPLAGSLFEPDGAPRAALLVASGTGVPRRFYARFARHAAAAGFATLTFDYRGIGGSAPDDLRGSDARYRDWGQRDIPGALGWMDRRYPGLPLFVVGHSTGGQQLGLAPNVGRVRAAVFVTVSTGYWRGMPAPYRYAVLALMRGYVPLTTRLLGYAPAKKVRWGENLPTDVVREWVAWSLEHDYMAAFFDEGDPHGSGRHAPPDGAAFGRTHFDEARFPIRAYCFSDDPISTRANVPPMLRLYRRAEVETRWYAPDDLGVEEVGHFGFFRPHVGAALWDDALRWLIQQGPGHHVL